MLGSVRFKRTVLMVALAGLVVTQGCRRKPAASATEPVAEAPPVPAVADAKESSPDRLPTAPNDSSLRLPIHQELTGAIHLYQMDHQKMPPDFDTLVRAKYLKAMPKPPPGKRFAVDRNRMQVVITD